MLLMHGQFPEKELGLKCRQIQDDEDDADEIVEVPAPSAAAVPRKSGSNVQTVSEFTDVNTLSRTRQTRPHSNASNASEIPESPENMSYQERYRYFNVSHNPRFQSHKPQDTLRRSSRTDTLEQRRFEAANSKRVSTPSGRQNLSHNHTQEKRPKNPTDLTHDDSPRKKQRVTDRPKRPHSTSLLSDRRSSQASQPPDNNRTTSKPNVRNLNFQNANASEPIIVDTASTTPLTKDTPLRRLHMSGNKSSTPANNAVLSDNRTSTQRGTVLQEHVSERQLRRSSTIDINSESGTILQRSPSDPQEVMISEPRATRTNHKGRVKITKGYGDESPDELELDSRRVSKGERHSGRAVSTSKRDESPTIWKYGVKELVFLGHILGRERGVEIYGNNDTFSIAVSDLPPSERVILPDMKLSKITQVATCMDGTPAIVRLQFSGQVISLDHCFLTFATTNDRYEFVDFVASQTGVRFLEKPQQWLFRAEEKLKMTREDPSSQPSPPLPSTDAHSHPKSIEESLIKSTSKPRLRPKLDAPDQITGKAQDHRNHKKALRSGKGLNRSAPGLESAEPDTRRLRTSQRRSGVADLLGPGLPESDSGHKTLRRSGKPWEKPLIYPRNGSHGVTVSWEDLARLEDDEFLNDTLVAFFIRYLQQKYPDAARNMHFFSSFFYEKLTQFSKPKAGTRYINYSGVASWTKKVDIFQRDYVIVPVNENAHWYVMIICNPKSLIELEPEDPDDLSVVDQKPAIQVGQVVDSSKVLLTSDILEATMGTDDTTHTNPASESDIRSARSRSRRTHKVPALKKYSLSKPIIVTLDSLNTGRSPTATNLKDYLVQEAMERKQLAITRDHISGMTAKKIPFQDNFVDCGLYLCMYLEKFMFDPTTFTKFILQREEQGLKWPRRVKSSVLRQRFYELLMELHQEQEEGSQAQPSNRAGVLIREEDYVLSQEEMRLKRLHALDEAQTYIDDSTDDKAIFAKSDAPNKLVVLVDTDQIGGNINSDRFRNVMREPNLEKGTLEKSLEDEEEFDEVRSPFFAHNHAETSKYAADNEQFTTGLRGGLRKAKWPQSMVANQDQRVSQKYRLADDEKLKPMSSGTDRRTVNENHEIKDDCWEAFDDPLVSKSPTSQGPAQHPAGISNPDDDVMLLEND